MSMTDHTKKIGHGLLGIVLVGAYVLYLAMLDVAKGLRAMILPLLLVLAVVAVPVGGAVLAVIWATR